ncbi:MAG TPA: MFS transporter [Stellaceae bacterium]|nr:MFS transporter [Stellaceae bacterium]
MTTAESAATLGPTDRADTYARKALFASAVGYAMDGFDLLILGFMMSAIVADLHLSPTAGASLATWTLVGAVLGGILFGALSDYFGRVKVLSWTILLFAIFTGLCALAQGYWDLVAYRTIAGLGLGGEFGIGMALAAEAWPASKRARVSSYVGLGWQAGVLVAALVTPVLLPVIGWRGMFALGILPAVVSFIVRRAVGEPEIFLAHRKMPRQGLPLRLLVKDWPTTKISLGMLILCAVQNFGYYGVMIWLPNYLASQFHYSITKSAVWVAVTILGMAVGIWLFGQLADRIGRRPIFFAFQAGAMIMVIVYSRLTGETALLIGGAVMGLFVNGMLGGYGALMSELYPTEARATAQNVLFNLGRAVGGFGPLVIGILRDQYSFTTAIALLAVIYAVDIVATALLIPERKGVRLE